MKKYRIDEIYSDQTTSIMAVFSVDVHIFQAVVAHACYASIAPVWVVIRQAGETTAQDMQGQDMPIDQLCQLVPQVEKFL